MIAGSQTADSRNRVAAIVSIVGIGFRLQFKQICSGGPIFAISQSWETGIKEPVFFAGTVGKVSAMNTNALLQAPHGHG
jgi:hypothetical protein